MKKLSSILIAFAVFCFIVLASSCQGSAPKEEAAEEVVEEAASEVTETVDSTATEAGTDMEAEEVAE